MFLKIRKFHKKTPVLESLLIKLQASGIPVKSCEICERQEFSCEIWKSFKNIFFNRTSPVVAPSENQVKLRCCTCFKYKTVNAKEIMWHCLQKKQFETIFTEKYLSWRFFNRVAPRVGCSLKFCSIHRKTSVLESAALLKGASNAGVFQWILRYF